MREEVKDRWVAALRSGQYRQAQGDLQDGQGFCCLGVLCQLAVDEGVISAPELESDIYRYDGEAAVLPRSVMSWSGVLTSSGELDGVDLGEDEVVSTNLTSLNDSECWDFSRIADLIERRWRDL